MRRGKCTTVFLLLFLTLQDEQATRKTTEEPRSEVKLEQSSSSLSSVQSCLLVQRQPPSHVVQTRGPSSNIGRGGVDRTLTVAVTELLFCDGQALCNMAPPQMLMTIKPIFKLTLFSRPPDVGVRLSIVTQYLLWPPNGIGQAIIFCPVVSSSIFFPSLFSVVEDWMSTILPHMVWP